MHHGLHWPSNASTVPVPNRRPATPPPSRIHDRSGPAGRGAMKVRAHLAGAAPLQAAQTSRTQPRSHRCAGSARILGCHSNETVISGVGSGSANVCMPARRLPVWRSGTLATRSATARRGLRLAQPVAQPRAPHGASVMGAVFALGSGACHSGERESGREHPRHATHLCRGNGPGPGRLHHCTGQPAPVSPAGCFC